MKNKEKLSERTSQRLYQMSYDYGFYKTIKALSDARRVIQPAFRYPDEELLELRKFKKEHPVALDNINQLPNDYRRLPVCNWEYHFQNVAHGIDWHKSDKPKIPVKKINLEHDVSVDLREWIDDDSKEIEQNTIYFNQTDYIMQTLGHFPKNTRNRYPRYEEGAESNARKSVRNRARIKPLVSRSTDVTHLIPRGYHDSESDTRLSIPWDSVLNRGAMNTFETKASSLKEDIYWLTTIQNSFKNEEGRWERFDKGKLVWKYEIFSAETKELLMEETYEMLPDEGDGMLQFDWNFGTDEKFEDSLKSIRQDKSEFRYFRYKFETNAKKDLDAIFGVDEDIEAVVFDFTSLVHLLVSGTTGSGKSVAVNAVILSMIEHCTPDQVQFVGIDPKLVEMNEYVDTAYWSINPQEVKEGHDNSYLMMLYFCKVMDCRFSMIQAAGQRDLESYNTWVENNPEEAEKRGLPCMAPFIIDVDEYADMKDQIGSDIEKPMGRIAQKGRACGVHMLVATQRPSVDVIPPTFRSNFPSRYVLKVSDSNSASVAIGGKELNGLPSPTALLGRGDGLILPAVGVAKRTQALYFDIEEIREINNYIRLVIPPQENLDFLGLMVAIGEAEYTIEISPNTKLDEKYARVIKKRPTARR